MTSPIPRDTGPLTRDEKKSIDRMSEHFQYVGARGAGYSPFGIGLMMVVVLLVLGGLSVILLAEAFAEYPEVFLGGGAVICVITGLLLWHRSRVKARMEAVLSDLDDRDSPRR